MDLARNAEDKGVTRFLYDNGLLNKYLNVVKFIKHFSASNGSDNPLYDRYKDVINIVVHNIEFKSSFFKKLLDTCIECVWVDIEQEYFSQLKNCKNKEGVLISEKVMELNRYFKYLTTKLEYLKIQDAQFDQRLNFQLAKLLCQEFDEDDFDSSVSDDELNVKLGKDDSVPYLHKAYVLNFNYTNTLYNYIREVRGKIFRK